VKILLDNCVHRKVKTFFPGQDVMTSHQAGLAHHENGELLAEAAKAFDVLVTTDKNIKSQHNLAKLPLPIIELDAIDTRIEALVPFAPFCSKALALTDQYWFVSIRPDGTFDLRAKKDQS
jgi:predicted nuclease of predicted toxin-antitoxin system